MLFPDIEMTLSGTCGHLQRWLAPEVMQGERAGPAADVFSFAVVLWEASSNPKGFPNTKNTRDHQRKNATHSMCMSPCYIRELVITLMTACVASVHADPDLRLPLGPQQHRFLQPVAGKDSRYAAPNHAL